MHTTLRQLPPFVLLAAAGLRLPTPPELCSAVLGQRVTLRFCLAAAEAQPARATDVGPRARQAADGSILPATVIPTQVSE